MSNRERIQDANKNMVIRTVDDPQLCKFGRIIPTEAFSGLIALADQITSIEEGANRYVASCPELEANTATQSLAVYFGLMPIQVGYCNGTSSSLNGLEWHKSIEIDIAVTDLILFLGKRSDLSPEGYFDSSKLACFYLEAGTVLELLPEVLHYAPCRVHPLGFKSIIALPKKTNEKLEAGELEAVKTRLATQDNLDARLLFMRNKWLIAHPEWVVLVEQGAFPGIKSENTHIHLGIT
jgi:hypothetical protein